MNELKLNEKQLANQLDEWFKEIIKLKKHNKEHFLKNNPIAFILKTNLNKMGHWRKRKVIKKSDNPLDDI